jgi:glucan phosphoethanolaminetransferase (alkaline phosphatase superfamily)
METLRPFIARIIAALVSALAAYAAAHWHIVIPDDVIHNLAETIAELFGIGLTVYSVVHTGINAKINPTDAASPRVAEKTKNA